MVPLYAGPSGKAILAFLPAEDYTANVLAAERVGEDVVALEAQLASIRELGYIAAVGDRIAGVGGLSVPVWDARGVTASVTISGPAERWTQRAMEDAAPSVKEAAMQLSRAKPGVQVKVTGFLNRKNRMSTQIVLHATSTEILEGTHDGNDEQGRPGTGQGQSKAEG